MHSSRSRFWVVVVASLVFATSVMPALHPALASSGYTIAVTTKEDEWDTDPATAPGTKCSLREALQAAHSNSLGNQGCGAVPLNQGVYTLALGFGTFTLSRQEELPNIGKRIIIDGNNLVVIDGSKSNRAFGIFIVAGGTLELSKLKLQNGKRPVGGAIWIKAGSVVAADVTFSKNVADNGPGIGRGGAVLVDGDSFSCTRCTFTENEARDAGGAVAGGNAAVTIRDSKFIRNQANRIGGAFASTGGSSVTFPYIFKTLFRENFVRQNPTPASWPSQYSFNDDASGGGAIHTTAYMKLEQVEFVKNYTDRSKGGGAIYNQGEIELIDSAITDSKAMAGGPVPATIGGAILNDGKLTLRRVSLHYNEATYGGAIQNRTSGQLLVFNSTIAENLAKTYGGIANGYNFPLSGQVAFDPGGTATLLLSSIVQNNDDSGGADGSPSVANVNSGTIIMGNALTDAPCVGTITSHGGNVFVQSCTRVSSDVNIDHTAADIVVPNAAAIKLQGLQDNGGAPLAQAQFLSVKVEQSSPATDFARDAWCVDPALPPEYELKKDQLNAGRPQGTRCDSGAVESGSNAPNPRLFWNDVAVAKGITFDLVLLDGTGFSTGTLKIRNAGGGSFNYQVLFASNPDGVYSISEGPVQGTLGQDQTAALTLRCAPNALGWQKPAQLTILTDAPGKDKIQLLLQCKSTTWNGSDAIAAEDTQPGPVSAGQAAPGGLADTQVALNNPSNSPLAASIGWQQPAANSPLAFSSTVAATMVLEAVAATERPANAIAPQADAQLQENVSIPPKGRLTLKITCAPSAPGLYTNTLLITTNDPKNATLSYDVSCEGAPLPEPDRLISSALFQQPGNQRLMGMALSPEGNQLLAGEWDANGILVYSIPNQASGQLNFQSRFTVPNMDTVTGIRYSADGKHVYYSSYNGNGVVALGRAANGTLTLIDTVTANDPVVCGVNPLQFCPRNLMRGARALDISPDDQNVYVTGLNDDTLTVLQRNPATGKLVVIQSFPSTVAGFPNLMLDPFGVVVSQDGHNVYVAARGSDALIAFSRNPLTGRLAYLTHVRDGSGGATGLNGATEANLSPDGRFVYVAGQSDGAVQILARTPADGFVTPIEAVNVGGAPYHVLTSNDADGARLTVALYTGDAVKVFSRDRVTGKLTPLDGQVELAMDEPVFLVASADDAHVYTTLYNGRGIRQLRSSRYVPLVQSVAPAAITAGSGDTTLTVTGARFYPASTVWWNGAPLATTFVSSRKLEALVPAALLASAGGGEVMVRTAPVGGGDSAALQVALTAPGAPPIPAVSGLVPESVPATGEPQDIVVYGSGFVPISRVLVNGTPVPTSYVSSSALVAKLGPDDVDAAGPLAIAVANSTSAAPQLVSEQLVDGPPEATTTLSAATTSAAVRFGVVAIDGTALPVIGRFEPGSFAAGSDERWLTVHGFNFVATTENSSVALWNGAERETVVLDEHTLQLRLSAADLAAAGTARIAVRAPGAGTADARSFTITAAGQNPVAQLDGGAIQLAPAQIVVSGADFVPGAVLLINGTPRQTTVINGYLLVAGATSADLRLGGVVQVVNPGSAASSAVLVTPALSVHLPLIRR